MRMLCRNPRNWVIYVRALNFVLRRWQKLVMSKGTVNKGTMKPFFTLSLGNTLGESQPTGIWNKINKQTNLWNKDHFVPVSHQIAQGYCKLMVARRWPLSSQTFGWEFCFTAGTHRQSFEVREETGKIRALVMEREAFMQSALWKPLICLVRSRVPNDQLRSQQNGKQILQGQESRQPLAFPKSHKPEKKKQSGPHIQQTQTKQGCAHWLFPRWTTWLGTHMFGQAWSRLSTCVKGGEYFCRAEPKVNPLCESVCEKGNKGSGFNKIKWIHVWTGM